MFWYDDMPDVTPGYERFSDLIVFFRLFMSEALFLLQIFKNCLLYSVKCSEIQNYRAEK